MSIFKITIMTETFMIFNIKQTPLTFSSVERKKKAKIEL
jgi:hypothetical protein